MPPKLITYLGIGKNPNALASAAPLWEEARFLARPCAWHEILSREMFYKIFSPYAAESTAIDRLLGGAFHVHLMAASIGEELEARSRHYLREDRPFSGFILDRMGSYLVEREIRKLDRAITGRARTAGRRTSRRYSPGYGDFSIMAQNIFIPVIGRAIPGLRVSGDGLVKPEKTVTALKAETAGYLSLVPE
jgi:hypothetical protein